MNAITKQNRGSVCHKQHGYYYNIYTSQGHFSVCSHRFEHITFFYETPYNPRIFAYVVKEHCKVCVGVKAFKFTCITVSCTSKLHSLSLLFWRLGSACIQLSVAN